MENQEQEVKFSPTVWEKLTKASQLLTFLLLASYAYGFVAWNFLLSKFSFFEQDFLQARYLSTGILFLVFVFVCFSLLKTLLVIFYLIIQRAPPRLGFSGNEVRLYLSSFFLCLVLDIFIFAPFVFPLVPQYLGGASPMAITILADQSEIEYLSQLNFPKLTDSKIQTGVVCQIYKNKEDSVILSSAGGRGRIVTVRNEKLFGISVTHPAEFQDFNRGCGLSVLTFLSPNLFVFLSNLTSPLSAILKLN